MKDLGKTLASVLIPAIFVTILWLVKIAEDLLHQEFHTWGIFPLTLSGLRGVIFSPFIHGSYQHLMSNSLPLLILGWALFYFYRELGTTITLQAWLMSGIWVWVFARESFHIGASGIIYAWAAFLFVSGVIRGHPRLMALSLLVAFLYGSLVWGIFPLRQGVSWEGHLMGMISGVVLALFYKNIGPQRSVYSWDLEEEDDDADGQPPYWTVSGTEGNSENPQNNAGQSLTNDQLTSKNHYTSYTYIEGQEKAGKQETGNDQTKND
jgi:membrane associated rhomboid family serine protease